MGGPPSAPGVLVLPVLSSLVRRTGALAPAGLLLGAPALAAPPAASVAYAFEAQLLDLGRHDATLVDYGFTPLGGGPLLCHSVRGDLAFDSGLWLGLSLRTSVASRAPAAGASGAATSSPQPTVIQGSWTAVGVAGTVAGPLRLGGDLGFAALSAAVSSTVQGGALVYLGPFVQPRLTWRIVDGPGVVELSAGWMLHTPLGAAHDQPLWEASFDRGLVQGPTLALHSGMGTRGWR